MLERNDELISAYLDNTLSDAERAALETRLADDAGLRRRLESLRATQTLLGALPELAAPRNFTLTRTLLQQNAPRRWRTSSLIASALSAAASIILFLVGMFMLSGAEAPNTDLQNGLTNNAVALAFTASAAPSQDERRVASTIVAPATSVPLANIQSEPDAFAASPLPTQGFLDETAARSAESPAFPIPDFGADASAGSALAEQDSSEPAERLATDIAVGDAAEIAGASEADATVAIGQAQIEELLDEAIEDEVSGNSADAAMAQEIQPTMTQTSVPQAAAPMSALPAGDAPLAGIVQPAPTIKPPTPLISPSPTKAPTNLPFPEIGAFAQIEPTAMETVDLDVALSDVASSRNDATETFIPTQVANIGNADDGDQTAASGEIASAPADAQPEPAASRDFTLPLLLIALGGFLFTLTFAILLYERFRGQ